MNRFVKIIIALSTLASLTACNAMVIGKYDEKRLKTTNGTTWGVPQARPTVWGFTGIPRDCKDCPAAEQAQK